ncbi:hypothetical protein C2G38_2193886 [Gigaspora rosea]|uniref:SHSP domain-containing protein n=1 Tax=Gigaspora rosea TaxID=44941 RepID=A0A397UZQ6_9GLOM|nr:hypothetical protein C2G38_2193886 [Gigaspora rosea]
MEVVLRIFLMEYNFAREYYTSLISLCFCETCHRYTRGVPKEGILIDLSLTVQGESKRKPTYEAATSRVSERKVEKFRKCISFTKKLVHQQNTLGAPSKISFTNKLTRNITLKRDNIEAKFQNGLLEIKIPRGSADQDHSKITIQ